jgi:hypothetical protein
MPAGVAQKLEPYLPTVNALQEEMIDEFNALATQGTHAIVSESMALKAVWCPAPVFDGQLGKWEWNAQVFDGEFNHLTREQGHN